MSRAKAKQHATEDVVTVKSKLSKKARECKPEANRGTKIATSECTRSTAPSLAVIISSAKTLDVTSPISDAIPFTTQPTFLNEASTLIDLMKGVREDAVMKSMRVSKALAKLTVQRFTSWKREGERPCLAAYSGGVYKKMDSSSFTADDWIYAQSCLLIVSGLYGLLRPLDLISPYRLEMAVKVEGASPSASLYDFWRDRLVTALPKSGLIVNLASVEYSTAFDEERLSGLQWIDIDFREKNGRIVAVHAKAARGLMARYIVRERCQDLESLKRFDQAGYLFIGETGGEGTGGKGTAKIKLTFMKQ